MYQLVPNGATSAYVLSRGTVTTLDLDGSAGAYDLNDSGAAVGTTPRTGFMALLPAENSTGTGYLATQGAASVSYAGVPSPSSYHPERRNVSRISCPITREYPERPEIRVQIRWTRLDAVRGISWHFATKFHRAHSNFVVAPRNSCRSQKGATSVALEVTRSPCNFVDETDVTPGARARMDDWWTPADGKARS